MPYRLTVTRHQTKTASETTITSNDAFKDPAFAANQAHKVVAGLEHGLGEGEAEYTIRIERVTRKRRNLAPIAEVEEKV